jgi:phosphoglycerate dehydrogenase-like enzyme
VGVDSVDLQAAKELGIVVTNTPGANSVSVAELTIALMLGLARQVTEAVSASRAGRFPRLAGITLEGKTVGIIGLGAIGRQLARRLVGFDCRLRPMSPTDGSRANIKSSLCISMSFWARRILSACTCRCCPRRAAW